MTWTSVRHTGSHELFESRGVTLLVELPRLADAGELRAVIARLAPAIPFDEPVKLADGVIARARLRDEQWLVGRLVLGLASVGFVASGRHAPPAAAITRHLVEHHLERVANDLAWLIE